MVKRKGYLEAAGIVLIAVGALALLYVANALDVYMRIVLAFAALVVSGIAMQKAMRLNGGYGFCMIGSRKGLRAIDRLSNRYKRFWNAMAMWGLVLGFGLITYPMLKGKIDKRIFAFGVLSSIAIVIFVMPYFGAGFQFINLPGVQSAISSQASSLQQNASLFAYAITAVTAIFGFTGYIFVSIFANAASILIGKSQIPGVAPIIPGVNIPLFAGIISLILLLVIHEFSHGVLSRIAKVKLKSIGLLVFGIIPIGAFVEPDEKKVKRLGSAKQTKIFSAGIAANFMAMIVFFVLLFFGECKSPVSVGFGQSGV
jgi:membrane-associated protease RseP (regulator of RpoE activity)